MPLLILSSAVLWAALFFVPGFWLLVSMAAWLPSPFIAQHMYTLTPILNLAIGCALALLVLPRTSLKQFKIGQSRVVAAVLIVGVLACLPLLLDMPFGGFLRMIGASGPRISFLFPKQMQLLSVVGCVLIAIGMFFAHRAANSKHVHATPPPT